MYESKLVRLASAELLVLVVLLLLDSRKLKVLSG